MVDPRKMVDADSGSANNQFTEKRSQAQSSSFVSSFSEDSPLGAQLAQDRELLRKVKSSKFKKPLKARVITVANQKGGVGKTTSAVNMAAALADGGLNVVVIDFDPQGNASTALGVDHQSGIPSIYDVITNKRSLSEILIKCPDLDRLYLAPATVDLSSAEIELVTEQEREYRLKRAVDELVNVSRETFDVDYVIIDCPPSLGLLTLNALVAAQEIMIPIQTEYYALEGLTQLMKTIDYVQKSLNPQLVISTILLTMYDKRTNLSQDVAQEVRNYFPQQTLSVEIPRNIRISEAPSFQQTVITYDPRSTGAVAYLAAAKELASRA